jgi:hypothetical protein
LLLKPEKSGPIKIIRPIEQFYLKFKALVIDNGGR